MSSPCSDCSTYSRKRSRDEFDFSSPIKKNQTNQIHTEVHIHTVNSLMEALRRQKELPKADEDEEIEQIEEISSNYHQRPFWPALQTVKQPK